MGLHPRGPQAPPLLCPGKTSQTIAPLTVTKPTSAALRMIGCLLFRVRAMMCERGPVRLLRRANADNVLSPTIHPKRGKNNTARAPEKGQFCPCRRTAQITKEGGRFYKSLPA